MKTFRQEVCNLYLWAIMLILPVIFRDRYADITGIKETFFFGAFGLFAVCVLIAFAGGWASDRQMGVVSPGLAERLRAR